MIRRSIILLAAFAVLLWGLGVVELVHAAAHAPNAPKAPCMISCTNGAGPQVPQAPVDDDGDGEDCPTCDWLTTFAGGVEIPGPSMVAIDRIALDRPPAHEAPDGRAITIHRARAPPARIS